MKLKGRIDMWLITTVAVMSFMIYSKETSNIPKEPSESSNERNFSKTTPMWFSTMDIDEGEDGDDDLTQAK